MRSDSAFWRRWRSCSWTRLLWDIEPQYPKGKRGRPPIRLERMLLSAAAGVLAVSGVHMAGEWVRGFGGKRTDELQ